MRREWLRFSGLVEKLRTRLRWLPEAVVLTLAALIVGGTIRATAEGADWRTILRSQAMNIAFGALLAGFGYLLFFLRFRQAQLTTYLRRSRLPSPRLGKTKDPDPLGKTIVHELLDARPPRACLIKGLTGTDSRLLADVAALLADKRRVPVVVDLANEASNASLPTLARDRFVTQLVGSSGDEANGRRLYASLVKKQKVVALIKGLDQVGQGKPLTSRRAALADLLEGLLAEQIPFVAWVNEDLAPSISEVAAFRARPMPDSEFRQLIAYKLRPRDSSPDGEPTPLEQAFGVAFDDVEPTRDLALINLALDMLVRRVRAGEDGEHAVRVLFSDRCLFRRHLAWMCEWTLNIALDEIRDANSPVLVALAAVGREAHFQREPELSWNDASRALDAESQRRFAAGIASLSQRDVVAISGSGSGRVIRFTHPMWFAFAGTLGLKLDPRYWRDLLQPGVPVATLNALTGALMTFGRPAASERSAVEEPSQVNAWRTGPDGRSFVRVLRQVGVGERTDISIEMVRAVILALQADGEPLDMGDFEVEVLDKSWLASADLNKLRFVSAVEFSRDPMLIDFLWRQVDYPYFDKNGFRVRRAICTRLGQLGNPAWVRLSDTWQQRIDSADGEDLATSLRNTPRWKRCEYPLASLGWVLPGLLLTIDEKRDPAYELLERLRSVQKRGSLGPLDFDPPDIGLEISLAEGFKAAAVATFTKGSTTADVDDGDRSPGQGRWWSQAFNLLESSQSWISQQALVQALALARPIAPPDVTSSGVRELIRSRDESAERHPLARETARLVVRALDQAAREEQEPKESGILPEVDIWFEAVEALEDGGVTLSPEAHRLLGLSTLLINLAEWRLEKGPGKRLDEQAVKARELVLERNELPRCFRRSGFATTMHKVSCSGGKKCSFHLCGTDALKGVLEGRRVFSRSFLQRAQATARGVPTLRTRFPLSARRAWGALAGRDKEDLAAPKAFEPIWRFLDEELQSGGDLDARREL